MKIKRTRLIFKGSKKRKVVVMRLVDYVVETNAKTVILEGNENNEKNRLEKYAAFLEKKKKQSK